MRDPHARGYLTFVFGHLLLMHGQNVPARNELRALLGRAPRAIGAPTDRNALAYR